MRLTCGTVREPVGSGPLLSFFPFQRSGWPVPVSRAWLCAGLNSSPPLAALETRFPKDDAVIVSHDIEFPGFDGEYPALQVI